MINYFERQMYPNQVDGTYDDWSRIGDVMIEQSTICAESTHPMLDRIIQEVQLDMDNDKFTEAYFGFRDDKIDYVRFSDEPDDYTWYTCLQSRPPDNLVYYHVLPQ